MGWGEGMGVGGFVMVSWSVGLGTLGGLLGANSEATI